MLIEKPKFYICPEFIIRQAYRPWEVAGSNQLRHDTFVNEQGIFDGNDRDEIDRDMITIVAVSTLAAEEDEVVGTVRIHQPELGVWWGSRLSVAPKYRRVGKIGPELIRFASVLQLSMVAIFFWLMFSLEMFHSLKNQIGSS